MAIVLHQFEMSHFNEKARWALNFKKVDHERESYLPGPHRRQIVKLSGQPQTPVLVMEDGEVVPGSAAIIDKLERRFPEPTLYPHEADAGALIEFLQEWDESVGPAVRTVVFSVLIDYGGYICAMFARHGSLLTRMLYRTTFPLAKGIIARGNGVADAANVERCFARTDEALNQLAEQTAATGYLFGNEFSVADLTAAALLAPLANVDHPDMRRPQPIPPAMQLLYQGYETHPAISWVKAMYRQHR